MFPAKTEAAEGCDAGTGAVSGASGAACLRFPAGASEELRQDSYLWGGLFFAVAAITVLSKTLQGYTFGVAGSRVTARIRSSMFSSLLKQELGWHDLPANASGRLAADLAQEAALCQALCGETLGRNIETAFTFAVGLTLAFALGDYRIGLLFLAVLPLMVFAMAAEIAFAAGGSSGSSLGSEAGEIVGEVVTSIRTITSFALEHEYRARFRRSIDAFLAQVGREAVRSGFLAGLAPLASNCAMGLLFWYGGYAGIGGNAFLVPLLVMFMIAAGMGQASVSATDMGKAAEAVVKVFEIIDRKSAIDYSQTRRGKKLENVNGDLHFENVHFAYPARPDHNVCNGYTLHVEAGTTVALVGASGSGKSTAVSLVERFYDPDQGSVMLDGVDLRDLNVSWLRQQIGLVGQEPVLFSGSILENISSGKPGASKEEVIGAAKMANAHDF